MAKTTPPNPSKAPAAAEAQLLSAEDTREETRAVIASAIRASARFAEANPEHQSTPQILAVLSDFYGKTCHEMDKAREQRLLGELAPMLGEIAREVLKDVGRKGETKDTRAKKSSSANEGTEPQPSESPAPSEEPQPAAPRAPVVEHLTKDAA